jgi:hypothetical protein
LGIVVGMDDIVAVLAAERILISSFDIPVLKCIMEKALMLMLDRQAQCETDPCCACDC